MQPVYLDEHQYFFMMPAIPIIQSLSAALAPASFGSGTTYFFRFGKIKECAMTLSFSHANCCK